ncbi:MAG: bifunctional precorrin-2 dehydrogenase/sirohydrochlorin ferrochelatase [Methylocystaceae bacterium]
MANLFPIMLNLENRPCLVVGGGEVATRKVDDLLDCYASVRVVSPQISPRIKELEAAGKVIWLNRGFTELDVEGMVVVISATSDESVNSQVALICRNRGIMVNVVDDPPKCDFFIPAVVRQGSLMLTVSTEGNSPLLAHRIKEELQQTYGEEYRHLVEILGEARYIIKESVPDIENRKKIFANLVEGSLLEVIRNEGPERAREWILNVYRSCRSESPDSAAGD